MVNYVKNLKYDFNISNHVVNFLKKHIIKTITTIITYLLTLITLLTLHRNTFALQFIEISMAIIYTCAMTLLFILIITLICDSNIVTILNMFFTLAFSI